MLYPEEVAKYSQSLWIDVLSDDQLVTPSLCPLISEQKCTSVHKNNQKKQTNINHLYFILCVYLFIFLLKGHNIFSLLLAVTY